MYYVADGIEDESNYNENDNNIFLNQFIEQTFYSDSKDNSEENNYDNDNNKENSYEKNEVYRFNLNEKEIMSTQNNYTTEKTFPFTTKLKKTEKHIEGMKCLERKRINELYEENIHGKYSQDNMMRKIKTNIMDYTQFNLNNLY